MPGLRCGHAGSFISLADKESLVGACGIFPGAKIKPVCPALRLESLSHWNTREVPQLFLKSHSV